MTSDEGIIVRLLVRAGSAAFVLIKNLSKNRFDEK